MLDASKGQNKMAYNSFKDLEIYTLSYDLAIKIHKLSLTLPKFELFEQGSQVRRAAKSIPANIAEGFGRRRNKKDFMLFLTYSLASCDETRVHLDILRDTGSLTSKELYDNIKLEYEKLGRMLNKFIQAVNVNHLKEKPESRIKRPESIITR